MIQGLWNIASCHTVKREDVVFGRNTSIGHYIANLLAWREIDGFLKKMNLVLPFRNIAGDKSSPLVC